MDVAFESTVWMKSLSVTQFKWKLLKKISVNYTWQVNYQMHHGDGKLVSRRKEAKGRKKFLAHNPTRKENSRGKFISPGGESYTKN